MSKKSVLYVLFTIICLAFLILALAGRSRFPVFNKVVTAIVLPVEDGITSIGHASDAVRGYWRALTVLQEENAKLKNEVEELRAANVDMIAVQAENLQLRDLLQYKDANRSQTTVVAKVVARNFGDYRDSIYINVGEDKGIKRDMAVVNNGLIGIVDEVYGGYARVLLITSPRCKIGARVLRLDSRALGIASGSSTVSGLLTMDQVYRNESLRVGDTIITSGVSGNHPDNIIIGQVTSVRVDEMELTQQAEIKPAEVADVEYVQVVTSFTPAPKIRIADEGGQAR